MEACKHDQQKVLDYFYDELSPDEVAEIEAHLETCDACKQELHTLSNLNRVMPQKSALEPDQATLNLLRTITELKLKQQVGATSSFPGVHIRWPQLAFGLILLLAGFFGGRMLQPNQTNSSQEFVKDLLMATGSVQAQNSAIDPFLLNVKKINFNAVTGDVEIEYNTINDIIIRGQANNQTVMELLQQALHEQENTSVRLHAVKAIRNLSVESDFQIQSVGFINIFEEMMDNERNRGIRYQIIQTLKHMPWDDNVKHLLIKIVKSNHDEAIRIEAFRTLVERVEQPDELAGILQHVKDDSTTFIRHRAEKLLEQYNPVEMNQPLELKREVGK